MTDPTPPADRSGEAGGSRHPDIEELAAYADGDLHGGDRERVAGHLAGCDECAADLEALEHTSAALASLEPIAMPDDVAQRLNRALSSLAEPSAATTVLPARTRRGRGGNWATGAAAAAVVALVASVGLSAIMRGGSDKKADTSTSASRAAAAEAPIRITRSGTNYTPAAVQSQLRAYVSQRNAVTAESGGSVVAAPAVPQAASPSSSAAGLAAAESNTSGRTTTPAPINAVNDSAAKTAAQAQLNALQSDTQRLAACIFSVTNGEVRPIALDFAQYNGSPALAIVLPHEKPQFVRVYFVGPKCGLGSDADVVRLEVVPTS